MTAPYMRGLLDDGQTPFNAGLPPGLLEMIGQPGKPGANMVQNMQMLGGMSGGRAAGGMRSAPEQVTAPAMPAPPAPGAPPAAPEAPSMATNNALMYGGMAGMKAAQGGNQGSLGASLGEALAAGTAAFTATKNAEKDKADALKRQDQFARTVRGLGLDAATREGIIAMGPVEGAKTLAQFGIDVAKEQAKPYTLGVGEERRGGNNQVLARNIKPAEPFDISKLSGQMRDAISIVLGRDPRNAEAFGAPLSEEEAKKVNDWIEAQDTRRAPTTRVSVGSPGMESADRTAWTLAMTQLNEEFKEVQTIAPRIETYDAILGQIKDGNYFSGSMAQLRTRAAAFGDMIGMPVDTDKITNSQTLLSELRNAALRRLPELDSRPTDKDMEILIEAIGNQDLTPEALERIFTRARGVAVREAERYKTRVQAFEKDFEGSPYKVPTYLKTFDVPKPPGAEDRAANWGVAGFEP